MPILILPGDLAIDLIRTFLDLPILIFFLAVLFSGKSFQHLSDKELVHKCTQKSTDWENIWREFQNRFGGIILWYIYKEFKKLPRGKFFSNEFHETVKDLKQDVYIKLLKNNARALKNFHGEKEGSFLAYLHVISRNTVINYVNTSAYRKVTTLTQMTTSGGQKEFESLPLQAVSTETVDEIEKSFFRNFIIVKIRECYQSRHLERDLFLFKLFYFRGLTARDIADNYNVNLTASGIETTVNRIIQRLKETIKK